MTDLAQVASILTFRPDTAGVRAVLETIVREAVLAERKACAEIAAEAAKMLGAAPGDFSTTDDEDCCQVAARAAAQDIGSAILDRT